MAQEVTKQIQRLKNLRPARLVLSASGAWGWGGEVALVNQLKSELPLTSIIGILDLAEITSTNVGADPACV